MAEGLALAASIIAVVQITNSVISICYDYGAAVKGASWQLPRLRAQLESLRGVLQQLEPLAKQAELAPTSADIRLKNVTQLCGPKGLLELCCIEVEELANKLETPSWSDGFGPKRRALIQVLRWPLKESDTEKALTQIGRFTDTLHLALTADDVALSLEMHRLVQSTDATISNPQHGLKSIQNTNVRISEKIDSIGGLVSEVDNKMESLQLETKNKAIYKWLSASDPSTNYNRGRRNRQADTGTWFTKSQEFIRWKNTGGSMLWLHGKPGCGKSVLSSTIISEVLDQHQPERGIGVAYFFFDFDDSEKQTPDQMVRCLIRQLSAVSPGAFTSLDALFADCTEGHRKPDLDDLLKVLRDILSEASRVYIVVDAMDECTDIPELLSVLIKCQSWEVPHSHTIFTSRRLRTIEDAIDNLVESQSRIDIQSQLVNQDISTYVQHRLLVDPGLQRWRKSPEVQEEIRSVLTGKADGMFRWAVCQLDTLRHCPNLPTLRRALGSLPETLDGTYARILNAIPEVYIDYALTILRWLTFCVRPLMLCELAEVITINVEGEEPWVDETLRFVDPKDLLSICSSLLELDDADGYGFDHSFIRLAHFSVKEYLISQRIRSQMAAKFWLEESLSHEVIGASCLAYLLTFDRKQAQSSVPTDLILFEYLFEYAVNHWTTHMRIANSQVTSFKSLITRFLRPECDAYHSWVDASTTRIIRFGKFCRDPLYQMALHGVVSLVHLLLEQGANVNEKHNGFTAIFGALHGGNESVVRSLLRYGADVNILSNQHGSPLQVACSAGATPTVYTLLEAGASINHVHTYSSPGWETALQRAARSGNLEMVQLLTSRGADVNLSKESQLSPLAIASSKRELEIVQHLLQAGADPNLHDSHDAKEGTPLQAACARQRASSKVVALLLENNASINAIGGRYGTAFQAACAHHDNFDVVKILLEKGADIHIRAGKYCTPLQAVSAENHDNVELAAFLIEKGVDVNSQGGKYFTALQAACGRGNQQIAKLLLENQANKGLIGGKYGSALHAACRENHEEIVKMLSEAGADLDLEAGEYGTALQIACRMNHAGIVMLLLKNEVDVNASEGGFGTALKITLNTSSKYDTTHVVKLLLENGAGDDDLSNQELEKLEFIKKLHAA